VLTRELLPAGKASDDHEKGWSGCLDRLVRALRADIEERLGS
jgi:hypothetical protein